jgi:hypothetical protein
MLGLIGSDYEGIFKNTCPLLYFLSYPINGHFAIAKDDKLFKAKGVEFLFRLYSTSLLSRCIVLRLIVVYEVLRAHADTSIVISKGIDNSGLITERDLLHQ